MAGPGEKPFGPVKSGNPRSTSGNEPGQMRDRGDPYEHKKQGPGRSTGNAQDVEPSPPRGYVKSQSAGVSTRKIKGPHKISP